MILGGSAPFLKLAGQRTDGIEMAEVEMKKDARAFELGEDVSPEALKFT